VGEALLVTETSAGDVPALTVVEAEAELLARLVSPALVLATAVLVMAPAALGKPTIVIVALAPGARSPKFAVTTPPVVDTLPTLDVAETKVTPAGRASTSWEAVAVLVELLFVTTTV
jgi:hypothetical protein